MVNGKRIVRRRLAEIVALEARRLMCSDHSFTAFSQEIGYFPAVEVSATTPNSAAAPSGASVAAAVPAYSSLPGAADTLYLDFDGHFEATWGGYSNITTPEFNTDATAGFSSAELTAINDIWRQVAEDYAPFNINVTTVEPASFADGVSMRVAIGGNSTWLGQSAGGVAYVNSYTSGGVYTNVVYVFPDNLGGGYAKYVAEASSHESGHSFGLQHQSTYDATGTKTNEYNPGTSALAPIMGNSYSATRGLWWNGTSAISSTTIQDDMAVIARSTNTFGYRPDDVGSTAATATALTVNGTSVSGSGIIGLTSDADYFSFTTGAGNVTLNLNVVYANNLDSKLELRSEDGLTLIASAAPTTGFGATITASLAAGNYRLVALSNGSYGDVGQYTITGTVVSPGETIAAPSNLVASATGTSIQLSWTDNAANEVSYRLERSTTSDFAVVTNIALAANSTGYADSGLPEGSTFYYRVIALGNTVNSSYSNSTSATTVPSAVTSTSASPLSSSQISVSWNNVAGETSYRIERSQDQLGWATAGTVGADVLSFTDSGRVASTTYYYRVISLNAAGEALPGPTANATTPAAPVLPAAPTNLRLNGTVTRRLVPLAWTDNASNETGFYVERSTNGGSSYSRIATLGAGVTTYNDTTVSRRKTYVYRVQAYNAAGGSGYTNTLSATTPFNSPTASATLSSSSSTSAKKSSVFSDTQIVVELLA